MKLSKHDKNMVAMSWLVEVFLNGLAMEKKDIPESKKEQYDELSKNYQTAFEIISDINKEFSHDLDTVFGMEFKQQLTDLTTILTILYQTTEIPKMLDYFKWIGRNQLVAKSAKKDEAIKNEDGLVELENGDVVLPISHVTKK